MRDPWEIETVTRNGKLFELQIRVQRRWAVNPRFHTEPHRWYRGWQNATPRDSQRQRVYDAETVLADHEQHLPSLGADLRGCAQFLATTMARAWFQQRWPLARLSVRPGYRRRRAVASGFTIKLPAWARDRRTALHELAHCVTRTSPSHGREFCHNFLSLVRFSLGQEAHQALRQAFVDHGVKYKPYRKPMSEQQKSAATRRLAAHQRTIKNKENL